LDIVEIIVENPYKRKNKNINKSSLIEKATLAAATINAQKQQKVNTHRSKSINSKRSTG